ncbi:MAG: NnrU family protein [Rhodobacteraceae bacterium]|nr:NnrU family protein [Paracoccaceae bacterium]
MNLLIAGVALWTIAHFFKRLAPEMRAGMTAKMGEGSKGVMALLILASIILMVFGYRAAPFEFVYELPSFTRHINNTLMIISVIMLGMGNSKGHARTWLRHPMLWGVVLWSGAHLLVNGDIASIVLFGGMALWALANMVLINVQEGAWEKPEAGPIKGDIKLLIISAVVFAVISGLHIWLGPNPFGG